MKKLSDIIEQDHAIQAIEHAIQNDRLHHCYIFFGPQGTGKSTVANIFARILNCTNTANSDCHNCISCKQIERGQHPDIIVVGEDRSEIQIKIEEIREKVIHTCTLTPYSAKWRFIIIKDAWRLNLNAANSILKTLEEPPKRTIFILTTSNISLLLPTIRSRGQAVRFSPIKANKILSCLENNHKITNTESISRAIISGGSLGLALNISTEDILIFDNTLNAVRLLTTSQSINPFDVAKDFTFENKSDLIKLLNFLEKIIEDILLFKYAPKLVFDNNNYLEQLHFISERMSFYTIEYLFNVIQNARISLKLNLQISMIVEAVFIEFTSLPSANFN